MNAVVFNKFGWCGEGGFRGVVVSWASIVQREMAPRFHNITTAGDKRARPTYRIDAGSEERKNKK